MIIREIKKSDLMMISRLHLQSFDKKHFTSGFSEKLLVKYFHEIISLNKYSYLAEESGEIAGYIIGGNCIQNGIKNFIKSNFIPVAIHMLLSPSFILEKITALFMKTKKVHISSAEYRIYIVAVTPSMQGKGIGKMLIISFENELKKIGVTQCGLSVRKGNIDAEMFYVKNNYAKENESSNSRYYKKNIIRKK